MFRSTIHTLKNNNYLRKIYNKQLKIIERKNNNNTIEYINIAYVTGTCFEKKLKKIRNVIKNHK